VFGGEILGGIRMPDDRMGEPNMLALSLNRVNEIPSHPTETDNYRVNHV
jgi:hypothetical protein